MIRLAAMTKPAYRGLRKKLSNLANGARATKIRLLAMNKRMQGKITG